jgi:hypothetical protein
MIAINVDPERLKPLFDPARAPPLLLKSTPLSANEATGIIRQANAINRMVRDRTETMESLLAEGWLVQRDNLRSCFSVGRPTETVHTAVAVARLGQLLYSPEVSGRDARGSSISDELFPTGLAIPPICKKNVKRLSQRKGSRGKAV